MITVVLPTAGIVSEHKSFEALFSFYEEGLHGLIRDMVMLSDQNPPKSKRTCEAIKRELHDSGLFDKIMRDYSHSPEACFLRHAGDLNHEQFVEVAVEVIYQSVVEMMNTLFLRTVYEVCKQRWGWIGDDLIAKMTVLEKPNE